MIAQHMTIIPTLKLFSGDRDIANIRSFDSRYHQLGGRLVYGTDTGFLTDYDQSEEFRQLMQAGFDFRAVLGDADNRARRAVSSIAARGPGQTRNAWRSHDSRSGSGIRNPRGIHRDQIYDSRWERDLAVELDRRIVAAERKWPLQLPPASFR